MRQDDFARQAADTIKTEIRTGRTFARIALDSPNPQKVRRNAANARKAYRTAKAWVERTTLKPADRKEIDDQLAALKTDLAKLPTLPPE